MGLRIQFGHPQAGRVTVGAWTFNLPSDAFQCVKVSDNIFETTLYLVKDFQFKFYKQRPWGGELASTTVNTQPVIYWVRDGITVIRQQVHWWRTFYR